MEVYEGEYVLAQLRMLVDTLTSTIIEINMYIKQLQHQLREQKLTSMECATQFKDLRQLLTTKKHKVKLLQHKKLELTMKSATTSHATFEQQISLLKSNSTT